MLFFVLPHLLEYVSQEAAEESREDHAEECPAHKMLRGHACLLQMNVLYEYVM